MIYDTIEQLSAYQGVHPNLDKAIARLLAGGFAGLEQGRYAVLDEEVFFFIQENTLSDEASDRFEYHKAYADVHWVMEGEEIISYAYADTREAEAFQEEADIGFVTSQKKVDFLLDGQNLALFLPGELHQPNQFAGGRAQVRKCVFKIRMTP